MRLEAPRVVTHTGVIDPKRLSDVLTLTAQQVNAASEGRIQGATNAQATPPTTGAYEVGDFVRNRTPVEIGAVAAKYIVTGWTCVAAPLAFVQCRALTGN